MPLPLLLGGAAVLTGVVGVGAGLQGMDDMKEAEQIAESAKEKYESNAKEVEDTLKRSNAELQKLGQLKVEIFTDQIKYMVDLIKRISTTDASAHLSNFSEGFSQIEMQNLNKTVIGALEIEKGISSGISSGALVGFGAYGSVGMLASASTGTAISTLSGAAATNATLAWLGGGSLAAGGMGVAGGTAVLGGLVASPVIAVMGFHMASKGEQALTEARAYEAEVEMAIAEMNLNKAKLEGIERSSKEMRLVLYNAVERFEKIKVSDNSDPEAFKTMIVVGKSIKNILDQPIITRAGEAIGGMRKICEGYLEV